MSSVSFYSHHAHLIRSQMSNKVLMPPEMKWQIRPISTVSKLAKCEFVL